MILDIFKQAKKASIDFASYSDEIREKIVVSIADILLSNTEIICKENEKDANAMDDDDPKKDRLILTPSRIKSIANACRSIASLPSPINNVILSKVLANKLLLKKITVPLGVIGVIYESRPNVTVDISALCLKSGNATILRGGRETVTSNTCIVNLIREAISSHKANPNLVQLYPSDRKYMEDFLAANNYIDMVIPRGSSKLIDYVKSNSSIPTIETGAGVCHTYVHEKASLEKAASIVDNAKHTRPSVCNSLDTILVDRSIAKRFLPMIVNDFSNQKTGIWADRESYSILENASYPYLHLAKSDSFGKEYLSKNCSIAVLSDLEEAINHISKYSSKHSEAIISEDQETCEYFIKKVDAAVVFSNTSTRFSDGEIFELGAEVGISTQKLHARGPFALEKLVTEKWVVRGDGQIRT